MSTRDVDTQALAPQFLEPASAAQPDRPLASLLQGPVGGTPVSPRGARVAEVLAIIDGGSGALLRFLDDPDGVALRGRSIIDLHGGHIGQSALLLFEDDDPLRPIVIGLLRGQAGWPLAEPPGAVEVSVDGERLMVCAKKQLVLQCGQASITLTEAGKVLIRGAYVLTCSTGMNRIEGGAVQIN